MGRGGGRKGATSRTPVLFSVRTCLLLLFSALVLDAACAAVVAMSSVDFDMTKLTLASILDFSNSGTDTVLMLFSRLLIILCLLFPFRINVLDDEAQGDSEEDVTPMVASPAMGGDFAAVAVDNEDEFAVERARSIKRARLKLAKDIALMVVFLVFTFCNGVVSVKCLFFHFSNSPRQEIALASTVLWVNLELFALQLFLNRLTNTTDVFAPKLHPHPLRFNHNVKATKCDVCSARIIKEDFECASCVFDCCIDCFKRKTIALGENQLTRSDKGVRDVRELSPFEYVIRSLRLLFPFWQIVAVAIGCLAINQGIRVVLPSYQGKVLDAIIGANSDTFWGYLRMYCILSTITLFLGSIRTFCGMLVMRNLSMSVRERLFSSIIYRDISFFDGTTVGSLTARMTNDVQAMVSPINTLMSTVLSNGIMLFGGVIMCMTVSWRLAMISFTVIGPIIYITGVYAKWSARINRGVWDALAQANSTATEAFTNIRTIRSFSTEEYEKDKFSQSMQEALSKTLRDAVAFSGAYLVTNMLDLGASAIILGFGGYLVMMHPEELTVGQLVTFQLYASMMNGAYQGLNGVLNQFTRSAGAAERVMTMLDGKPDIDPVNGMVLSQLTGRITFTDVSFYYQMRPDRMVLNNLSLTFEPSSVTAIVGRSGGGKSTLMHLVLRHYDPQHGEVSIDGNDIRDLSLQWLHHQCAVVAQDTQLFNTTIEGNITYGLENYTFEELRAAAVKANAHDFITGFPEGYKTTVGEHGVRLSGGQRQRIAIARALLRKPRVLLLDEATSALDSESEALVQEALDDLINDLQQSCTIIVIAHRLSTVVNASRIIVLQDGAVAEQGTHTELLANHASYWHLVNRQISEGRTTINFDEASGPTTASQSPMRHNRSPQSPTMRGPPRIPSQMDTMSSPTRDANDRE